MRNRITRGNSLIKDKLTVETLLPKIKKLPPLNLVVRRLMEVVRNEYSSADDVTKVLSSDQAIACKVLELVNSSFYGFPGRISTISRAVVILGNKSIQNLALAFASMDIFKDASSPLDLNSFWEHSIMTAASAQILASKSNYPVPEEAFIAGLLHDIGQLVLGNFVPEQYEDVLKKDHSNLLKNERRDLGLPHTKVGSMLLEHWNLPPLLSYVVNEHHSRLSDYTNSEDKLLVIIKTAEIISWLSNCSSIEGLEQPDAFEIIKGLEIPTSEYESIIKDSVKLALSMQDFLKIADTSLDDKFKDSQEQEMLSIAIISDDNDRAGWIKSLIEYYGFHVIKLPTTNPTGLSRFNPQCVIIDPLNMKKEVACEILSFFKAQKYNMGVLELDSSELCPLNNIFSELPQLPLIFQADEINRLIENKQQL